MASVLVAACGGGSDASGPQGTVNSQITKLASAGCGQCAFLRTAPSDGETISGFVRLDFTALNIQNAELLPESGYEPKYGRFNLRQTDHFVSAAMDLDTTKLPNGPIKVRIAAFDAPAGQQGRETVVMTTRTWIINNPVVPGDLSIASVSAPVNGASMSGMTRLEVRGTGLTNVELLPESGYSPKAGVFNVSADRTFAWLDFDTRTQTDGIKNMRISAFSVTEGQAEAREIVAMPARQWNFQNGLGAFAGNAIIAPVHGSILSGNGLYVRIQGSGLENVELLPGTGYAPKMGTVQISADKTQATVYADLSTLPKGVNEFRVSAFSKPAGAADAHEIVVMPARQFDVK